MRFGCSGTFCFFLTLSLFFTVQALKMKDEQLRILSDQNAQLLGNLDKVEEDANNIQMEKLAVEEENRSLRDVNFELQVQFLFFYFVFHSPKIQYI
jgi:hypothetical protein